MEFTSSFFEQDPEFVVESATTEDLGGGAWASNAWWNDSSLVGVGKQEATNTSNRSSNSSSSSNGGGGNSNSNSSSSNDSMFDPFLLPKDSNNNKDQSKKQCINSNKITFYSVSSKTLIRNNKSPSNGRPPLAPWRVDLDDSALLLKSDNSMSLHSVNSSSIITKHPQQQQKQKQPVSRCLVDLDDTVSLGQTDDEDDDDDQYDDYEANHDNTNEDENVNVVHVNTSNDRTGNQSSLANISSSSTTPTTTTTSAATSPIDPWRFHVADRSNDDTDTDHYDSGIIASPSRENDSHNMADDSHHHHHENRSMDPWIEIDSINDESTITGCPAPPSTTTSPFHIASHHSNHHNQQHSVSALLPKFEFDEEEEEEEENEIEGRDDSPGDNNNAKVFQKNMMMIMMNHDEDAITTPPHTTSTTQGNGGNSCRMNTPAPSTGIIASSAARVVTPTCASVTNKASTTTTSCTKLQQRQQEQLPMINEDSFGFAPFHALDEHEIKGDVDRDNNNNNNNIGFGESNCVFGQHHDDGVHHTKKQYRHHQHHKSGGDSYCGPPDNVDPYNSLAIIEDDDSTNDDGSNNHEESTAAHAVNHFHQDESNEVDDDNTLPSFIKRRSFEMDNTNTTPCDVQQNNEDNDDYDCNDADEVVMVVEVQASDEDGAFEVVTANSGKAAAACGSTRADTDVAADIATAAASSVSAIDDDPPLQVVESVDEDNDLLQNQDDDGRIYVPNRSPDTSSADHGSGSGPASTTSFCNTSMNSSGRSWAECTSNSWTSTASIEQSKRWITLIVAHELWSDDWKVVEMAMGTLHRILLRSILHVPQVSNNDKPDNSNSLITESMSSRSGSGASSNKRGKANISSNRTNANKYELIELAFCRGCPLAVVRAMKAHPTNTFLQDSGLCILNVFCWNGVATHVVEVGSLEIAMAAIEQSKHMLDNTDEDTSTAVATRRSNNNSILKNSGGRNTNKGAPEVVESAIYHIANLVRDKNLAARVLEAHGLEAIVDAMKRLLTQADVQLAGCCAFRNLLQHHKRIIVGRQWANKVVKVGAIDRVIAALDDHPGNEKLQLEGYKILRRLSKLNNDCQDYRQDIDDSHDDCHHNKQLSQSFFRARDHDEPDLFAPSFEI